MRLRRSRTCISARRYGKHARRKITRSVATPLSFAGVRRRGPLTGGRMTRRRLAISMFLMAGCLPGVREARAALTGDKLVLESFRVVDVNGDNDGYPDTNETVDL